MICHMKHPFEGLFQINFPNLIMEVIFRLMDSPINLARDYESRINCVMVMDVAIILK